MAERAAPWVHASTVLIPPEDVLDEEERESFLLRLSGGRDRLTPEDMLAVAFNGLVRQRLRGSHVLSGRKESPAETLRSLAFLIEAFDKYPPGAFFTTEELRDVAKRRSDESDGN